METGDRKIKSYSDLDVFQRSYKAGLIVSKEIAPFLKKIGEPSEANQILRSSKAIPALIAEGYAKRFQPKHLQKYIDDGIGEANESSVHISYAKDLGHPNPKLCKGLMDEYTIIGKQLYAFGKSWQKVKENLP